MDSHATSPQDLQELEGLLLRGIKTVKPRATECIPGTRIRILEEVTSKTSDCNGTNIICIRGAPGSGKSSISLTAKSLLHGQRRLVTYFRFDRNEAVTTTPTALWCNVAYGLARRLPSIRTQLLQKLREGEVDLDSPMDVFTSLVQEPLSNVKSTINRPLVIIIDALDECGGLAGRLSPDRQFLLQTIRRWSQFSSYFKLLVTSRLEGDIIRVLSSISISIDILSGYSLHNDPQIQASIETSQDIRTFLESRFELIRAPSLSLPQEWPGQDMIIQMVYRAAGNFMWATTATNFIHSGINPQERLETIMSDSPESESLQPLYSLYSTILDTSFGKIASDSSEADILRAVLGVMILAQRPFHDIEYTKLPTAAPVSITVVEMIRDRLRSVLDQGRSLRFVHKSFDDFLLSKECPSKYAIRRDEVQHLLTKLCLTTLAKGLRFNVCGLETSCLKNVDVPDIEIKVTACIPPLLSYSCCFLAGHLGLTPFDEYLMQQIQEMIMDKLLYWFEAMSLLKEVNRITHSLLLILKWSHSSPDEGFKDFLQDARRFIAAFVHPIAQSAPHIYISALPFAPEYSSVAKHFLPHFPWTLALSTGKATNWSSHIFTTEHHKDWVEKVAFSPDEKYFVSGSWDETICVYDSEAGDLISGPFKGDGSVESIFFGPGSRHVWASFGGKVICWDIKTGDERVVFHSLEGATHCRFNGSQNIISAGDTTISLWNAETGIRELHRTSSDWFHVSISPDGRYIARAHQDDTAIDLWEVVDGTTIQRPSHSLPQFRHTKPLSTLSFSVLGNFAVSGSKDGTILIWDATTGDTIGRPLDTRAKVDAVAYTPHNQILVSSSGRTGTVLVWNALTHEAVLEPLKGHTSLICEIALSRNGLKALTASFDKTVRMWDLSRKEVIPTTRINEDHVSEVMQVTFSPSGKYLASIDWHAIRVWDVGHPGQPLLKHNIKNVTTYEKIIFSPDSNHIVAYCAFDDAVGAWDVETGELTQYLDLADHNRESAFIEHVSFRSIDQRLVTCSTNGAVRIWNFKNGILTEDGHILSPQPTNAAKGLEIIALSPDGLIAIVRDFDRSPPSYMWSTTTHLPLPLTFADGEQIPKVPVAYSPSGNFFASIQWHPSRGANMLQIWSTQTGEIFTPTSTFEGVIHALAFSPNDRYLAVSHRTSTSMSPTISIYDVNTCILASGPWRGHSEQISTLAFSPDGDKLVSGSDDCQIRVWNMSNLLGDLQATVGPSEVADHVEDGWVKDVDGNLIFWVPKDHRASLAWSQSVLLYGSERMTELDLLRFRYGVNWAQCFVDG